MENYQILDLDELKPKPRFFTITDSEDKKHKIDVSRVPFDVTVTIMSNQNKFSDLSKGKLDEDTLSILLNIVIEVVKVNMQECNMAWVQRNLDIVQCMALMLFVLDPVLERINSSKIAVVGGLEKGTKDKIKT